MAPFFLGIQADFTILQSSELDASFLVKKALSLREIRGFHKAPLRKLTLRGQSPLLQKTRTGVAADPARSGRVRSAARSGWFGPSDRHAGPRGRSGRREGLEHTAYPLQMRLMYRIWWLHGLPAPVFVPSHRSGTRAAAPTRRQAGCGNPDDCSIAKRRRGATGLWPDAASRSSRGRRAGRRRGLGACSGTR